ncbi:MAG: CotH kinase family protein [Eubacteriales bacterium]
MLRDLDFAFKTAQRTRSHRYFRVGGTVRGQVADVLQKSTSDLRKTPPGGNYCVERYVEVVETYFNAQRATALFDEMVAAIRPEMPRQIARWGKPGSMSEWEKSISQMRYFIEERPAYALENMRKYFGVSKERLNELIAKYKQ